MPSAYSLDLRKKVMSYVNKNNSCNSAAIKFDLSPNTVRNWYKRHKAEGHYMSRKVGGKKGRVTPEEVSSYIKKHPNFILSEMGAYFNMTAAGAHYWLKKLGYSYKKKLHLYGSQRRTKKGI